MTNLKTENDKPLCNTNKKMNTATLVGSAAAVAAAAGIPGVGVAVAGLVGGVVAAMSSFRTTLSIPGDKKVVYEKYKELVPDVSGKIVEFIEDFVNKHEASQSGMSEQTVHKGVTHKEDDIFLGTAAKFIGVKIAEGPHPAPNEDQSLRVKVYLTKKNKFLYAWELEEGPDRTITHDYHIYDSYSDMKSELTIKLAKQCEEHLSKHSNIRTYEILDI